MKTSEIDFKLLIQWTVWSQFVLDYLSRQADNVAHFTDGFRSSDISRNDRRYAIAATANNSSVARSP